MKIRPLHDRVIVKRLEEERKTASGIVIPDAAAEKPDQGQILAVGLQRRTADAARVAERKCHKDLLAAHHGVGLAGLGQLRILRGIGKAGRDLVVQHIGVGAGGGIEELQGNHGGGGSKNGRQKRNRTPAPGTLAAATARTQARQFPYGVPRKSLFCPAAVFRVQRLHKQPLGLGRVFFTLEKVVDRANVQAFATLRAASFHLNSPCRG